MLLSIFFLNIVSPIKEIFDIFALLPRLTKYVKLILLSPSSSMEDSTLAK